MNRYGFYLAALLIAAMLGSGYAEDLKVETAADTAKTEKAYEGKIVVSARGYQSRLSQTPGGVGVIAADEMRLLQPNSITDALRTVPGVSESSDSAWGSEICIRGASRDNVVFLIDGTRLVTATDIGAQFGTIDPMAVERVEILKGPISSLYGSGTIGGVVNVITRNGSFSAQTEVKGGLNVSYNSNSGGVNTYAFTALNSPSFYAFASGSYRDHGSYEDGDGNEMKNSQFTDMQGIVNLGLKLNDANRIEVKSQYFRGEDIGIPGAVGTGIATTADVTYDSVVRVLGSLDYTYEPGGGLLRESKLHLAYHAIDRNVTVDNLPASTAMASMEPEASHYNYNATWTNRFQSGSQTIVAGVDAWMRAITSERTKTKLTGATQIDTPLPDAWYLSTGAFIEDDWKIARMVTVNVGGRVDRIQVRNDETSLFDKPFVETAANRSSGKSTMKRNFPGTRISG
jgi:hemoglobin/transferrin/lactoferrin receptor protein